MSRTRAALGALLLVFTSTYVAPAPSSAHDPLADSTSSPNPRNTESSAAKALSASNSEFTGAVVDNALFQLGINPEGHMNLPGAGSPSSGSGTTTVGLRYVPENNEVLAPGCLCEGWGVGDRLGGVSGWASEDAGISPNLSVVDFHSSTYMPDVDIASSTVEVGGVFRVRHDFAPSQFTPNLYEILVTVENISASPVDLVYRRTMDWDVEPTEFDEYVTIQGSSDFLEYSSDDGFAVPDPLAARTSLGSTGMFVDAGPDDHGALFDFAFGSLAPGATRQFQLFYGAAPDEHTAEWAVHQVNADVWSFGEPNVPDGPDADTLLDGKEQGKPNTFIFAFSSSDQCDEENHITLAPAAGGRVAVEYDPRFAAPDADPRQEDWSRRIAEAIQDRAEATLDEYAALGFGLDETVAVRLDCSTITGRAWTESGSLVHLLSGDARTWFGAKIRLAQAIVASGGELPARGFSGVAPSPRDEWVNVLDHELGHTWQYREVVPEVPVAEPLAFWLNYLTANRPVVESAAVLSQDLVTDADDADPLGVGAAPYPQSYMDHVRRWMDAPDALTATNNSEYRKAALFQFWAEHFGQSSVGDLEQRTALFARDMLVVWNSGLGAMGGALASCDGSCPDLLSALRDFYVAAYVHDAPNVNGAQNSAFEILDSVFDHNGVAGGGQTYPPIVVTALPELAPGNSVHSNGETLAATAGRVYQVGLGQGVSTVEATLSLTSGGFGQDVLWALVPIQADGTVNFGDALLSPDPSQLQRVQVPEGGRLGAVVVAGNPLLPWDDAVTFDLRFDAPIIAAGASSTNGNREPAAGTATETAQLARGGIALFATPTDGRTVTIDVYPSEPGADVTVRRLTESGASDSLGTYPGGATVEDGPLTTGRYLYEATATIGGSAVTVYSGVVSVADDVTPPRAWFELNGRAPETNQRDVRALIGGLSEDVTETRFAFSEDELNTAAWQPFRAYSTVELPAGNETYQVFVQLRDPAGLVSEPMIGEVELDAELPTSAVGPLPSATQSPELTVPFVESDGVSFVNYVELWTRYRPDAGAEWGRWTMVTTTSESPATLSLPFGLGLYEFYSVAVDAAGNREEPPAIADAVTTYSTSPAPTLTVQADVVVVDDDSCPAFECCPCPDAALSPPGPLYDFYAEGVAADDNAVTSIDYQIFAISDLDGSRTLLRDWSAGRADDETFDETSEPYHLHDVLAPQPFSENYELNVRASDGVDSAVETVLLTPVSDSVPPVSSADDLDPAYGPGAISIALTASDDHLGPVSVVVWGRRRSSEIGTWSAWAPVAGPQTTSPIAYTPGLGDGQYEFYTIGEDRAGNTESSAASADASTVIETIDDSPEVTAALAASKNGNTVTLSGSGTGLDDRSGVTIRWRLYGKKNGGTQTLLKDWSAATPSDGAFEENVEQFTIGDARSLSGSYVSYSVDVQITANGVSVTKTYQVPFG